ncbi:MAG: hypothetical protein INR64_00685 [Caulobacteraceae bacterium]|nr:hypothetical protein [Caulobacter sp.]
MSLEPAAAELERRSGGLRTVGVVRAARLIVDRLTLAERRRVAAVVACVPGPPEQGAAAARLAVSALSLSGSLPLHVSGLASCGLFTALHLAHAVLGRVPEGLVLVVRSSASGGRPAASGALLLGTQGGVACRPLPPGRAQPPSDAEAEVHDRLSGSALALMLARAGYRPDDVQRVAHPGAAFRQVERLMRLAGLEHAFTASLDMRVARASTPEAAIGAAVQTPPGAPTLLWARDPDGQVGACLLDPG